MISSYISQFLCEDIELVIVTQTCTPTRFSYSVNGAAYTLFPTSEIRITLDISPFKKKKNLSHFLTTIESVTKSSEVYLLNISQILFFSLHFSCLHSSKYIISCLDNLSALLDFLWICSYPCPVQSPHNSYYVTHHVT